MPKNQKLIKSLDAVLVPGVRRSLVKMNLVKDAVISDGKATITLVSTALPEDVAQDVKDAVEKAARSVSGVKEVAVSFVEAAPKDVNQIGSVIAVMSGKGGVGKSLVAGLAATALRKQGFEVGILDADITGPSIPRMFGIGERPIGNETGILPVSSESGIEVMSINLLLANEADAVIWRGPLIARAITQFWEEVLWGKLDYLVVDLPPGTADAPLTVLQQIPVSGIIVVFTPQDLTAMIVRKAISMARDMGKPILGVIENMSYLEVPETGKRMDVFGKSRAEEMAGAAGAPLLARLPIDPRIAALCDEGAIERYDSEVVAALGQNILKSLKALRENKHD